jgi:hypothetical protein
MSFEMLSFKPGSCSRRAAAKSAGVACEWTATETTKLDVPIDTDGPSIDTSPTTAPTPDLSPSQNRQEYKDEHEFYPHVDACMDYNCVVGILGTFLNISLTHCIYKNHFGLE